MRLRAARLFLLASLSVAACNREDVPVRYASIDVTIGAGEEGTPNRFGDISGVAVDKQGRIYIADGMASEVRVFSPEGSFLYTIGGAGNEPGKLFGPCCLAFDATGQLWVRDGGNLRYSAFAPDASSARYLFSVPMPHRDVIMTAPVTFDRAGNLIDIARLSLDTLGAVAILRFTVNQTGEVLDSLTLMPVPPDSLEMTTVQTPEGPAMIHAPFRIRDLIAHGPNGDYARVTSSRYDVSRFDAKGTLLHSLVIEDAIGPPLNNEERHRAAAIINEEAKLVGRPGTDLAAKLPFRKQPISGLYFDQDGRIWVERSTRLHENSRADVWDANGIRQFIVEWPNEVRLANGFIQGNTAFGIQPGPEQRGGPRLIKLLWK
jgi:hypothetical protein